MLKMMSIVDDTVYLEQKTVAHWIAMNQLELLRIKNKHSNRLLAEEISGEETMAGRQWYWRAKPKKTGDDGFIQIEMSVSAGADDEPIMTVMSLTDRYHKAL
jgi:general secretion pathway protein I